MKFAADFRSHARESLANHWWLAVGISFLASILGGNIGGSISSSISYQFNSNDFNQFTDSDAFLVILPFLLILIFIVFIITIAQFILGGAIQIGYNRFCLDLTDHKNTSINRLFSGFNVIWKALGLRVVIGLFTFLWTLLFIIPGIIASYRYSQAMMILAENPDIDILEAINRSKSMMQGNKWRLFCLQFSFIGWSIACLFTCGIGYLWLSPYINVATASFYREVSGTWNAPSPNNVGMNSYENQYNNYSNNNYYNNNNNNNYGNSNNNYNNNSNNSNNNYSNNNYNNNSNNNYNEYENNRKHN